MRLSRIVFAGNDRDPVAIAGRQSVRNCFRWKPSKLCFHLRRSKLRLNTVCLRRSSCAEAHAADPAANLAICGFTRGGGHCLVRFRGTDCHC